jgi:hypothetical protein
MVETHSAPAGRRGGRGGKRRPGVSRTSECDLYRRHVPGVVGNGLALSFSQDSSTKGTLPFGRGGRSKLGREFHLCLSGQPDRRGAPTRSPTSGCAGSLRQVESPSPLSCDLRPRAADGHCPLVQWRLPAGPAQRSAGDNAGRAVSGGLVLDAAPLPRRTERTTSTGAPGIHPRGSTRFALGASAERF